MIDMSIKLIGMHRVFAIYDRRYDRTATHAYFMRRDLEILIH